jgi:hypothetical protein
MFGVRHVAAEQQRAAIEEDSHHLSNGSAAK